MRRLLVVLAVVVGVGCSGKQAADANERGKACPASDHACAVKEFGEAVRLDPGVAKYHHNLARALAIMRHYDQALVECREALRIEPANLNSSKLLTYITRRVESRQADNLDALLH